MKWDFDEIKALISILQSVYSKVFNIDAHAQNLKKLQKKFSCTDFEICLQIFCDFFQLFTYNFIIFKKWMISLILKIVKFHIDDYFWLFIFITLKLLIDHMNHTWSMKLCHHVWAHSSMFLLQSFISSFLIMQHNIFIR